MRPLAPTILLAALPVLAAASQVFSVNETFNGYPVNATATFTTGNGTTMITVQNLEANPTDVAQAISAIAFNVGNPPPTPGVTTASLTSSSGQPVTIASNGTYTMGAAGPTGWAAAFDAVSQTILVSDFTVNGGSFPTDLLIGGPGPGGTYSNADSTIAGSGVYNPFLFETATFTINTPGTTANSAVSNVDFTVGPRFGVEAAASSGGGATQGGGQTPEPATFILAGAGFILAGLVRRRRVSR